jgi:hypothetical protein
MKYILFTFLLMCSFAAFSQDFNSNYGYKKIDKFDTVEVYVLATYKPKTSTDKNGAFAMKVLAVRQFEKYFGDTMGYYFPQQYETIKYLSIDKKTLSDDIIIWGEKDIN